MGAMGAIGRIITNNETDVQHEPSGGLNLEANRMAYENCVTSTTTTAPRKYIIPTSPSPKKWFTISK